MRFLQSLKERWKLEHVWQVVVILVVFACTGFTVLFLKTPIKSLIYDKGEQELIFTILYYVLILPIYNMILLVYGFIFGQFHFFWNFEKKMWYRMTGKKK